jgi:uncharacterized Zn-finger protein
MPAHTAHPIREDFPEQVIVRTKRVACDGVGGVLGHPRVFLEMGADNTVDCPYCDRKFVLAKPHGEETERLAPGVYEGSAGH